MPLQVPILDDRNFEQLLDEAKRRIPVFTPEWTNFGGESDPGITLVQLFAFLTDTLIYRANRIPERNRLKFLQLLGIPLQPARSATGLVCFHNERGPLEALPLNPGVVVTAGEVEFRTVDGVTVLPLESQVYYKHPITKTDPRYDQFKAKYEAVRLAEELASTGTPSAPVEPTFYETRRLSAPTLAEPNPFLDLATTQDQAFYLALLAPSGMDLAVVRDAVAHKVLSIGVVPALDNAVDPLRPLQTTSQATSAAGLIYEIPANAEADTQDPEYRTLSPLRSPDVLQNNGVVQLQLPAITDLRTWEFTDPLQEGTGTFPPRLEDEQVRQRLLTWLRVRSRIPDSEDEPLSTGIARLSWLGINTTRIYQAVAVVNELVGQGNGESDQTFVLVRTPVLSNSVTLMIQDLASRESTVWRKTDDLLTANAEDRVFTLDPESGQIRFGDGLRGARPPAGSRILASYEYGGGPQGNVAIGAVKACSDTRLQGGYRIENPIPTSGGDLGESVSDGERQIPLVLRHRDRLVSWQDFRDVTLRTPGVDIGRVGVLPLFRPGDQDKPPEENLPGVVTLLVIPRFDSIAPLWPSPDRLFLRRICDYLDTRRLVTTEIHLRGPKYKPIYLSVGIKVNGGSFPDTVKQVVKDRLQGYLSALPPGGPLGAGWPLKKRLLDKDLEAVATRVPGVDYVEGLELGDGTPADLTEILLSGLQLPKVIGLQVTEGQPEPLSSLFGRPTTVPDGQPPPAEILPVPVIKTSC